MYVDLTRISVNPSFVLLRNEHAAVSEEHRVCLLHFPANCILSKIRFMALQTQQHNEPTWEYRKERQQYVSVVFHPTNILITTNSSSQVPRKVKCILCLNADHKIYISNSKTGRWTGNGYKCL